MGNEPISMVRTAIKTLHIRAKFYVFWFLKFDFVFVKNWILCSSTVFCTDCAWRKMDFLKNENIIQKSYYIEFCPDIQGFDCCMNHWNRFITHRGIRAQGSNYKIWDVSHWKLCISCVKYGTSVKFSQNRVYGQNSLVSKFGQSW